MTSKDNTDRPKDTCAQFVVKSFRRAQEHPMGRQMCAYMASKGKADSTLSTSQPVP